MQFSSNFYAEVEEKNTGIHAFELLIDRYTGSCVFRTRPEYDVEHSLRAHGWNDGPLGRATGRRAGCCYPERAREIAQGWLDKFLPGTSAEEQADAFYGYYTIHVIKDGQVYGMLSVNGYSGDVWYHTWHGDFVSMKELEQ